MSYAWVPVLRSPPETALPDEVTQVLAAMRRIPIEALRETVFSRSDLDALHRARDDAQEDFDTWDALLRVIDAIETYGSIRIKG